MSDLMKRGAEIKRRRLAYGIDNPTAFEAATGVDRATIKRVEAGVARESTYDKLEAWLDAKEYESGSDYEDAAEHARVERTESTTDDLAVVELYDIYGVGRVVVKAREGHIAEQVEETLRGIRQAMNRSGSDE